MLCLLLQLLLAWLSFQRVQGILSGSPWSGLHAVGALFSMLAAAGLGMAGLEGMIKASLGSIAYRVSFALSATAISLVSGGFVLLFFVLALGMVPGSFRLPLD